MGKIIEKFARFDNILEVDNRLNNENDLEDNGMEQDMHSQFLQVLLKAYQLGESSQDMTAEQVLHEIIPQLKALLATMHPSQNLSQ